MGIYDRDYLREEGLNLRPSWNNRSAVETLLIVNVVIFVANALLSPNLIGRNDQGNVNGALLLHSSDAFQPWMWWRFLTYSFAHNAHDVFHLVFNMLGLYFLGRAVEQRYGRNEFLRIYFITAVIGAIGWVARDVMFNGGGGSLLGASGAVICIEMLFVFNYPRETVVLFVFPVPAWVLGILLVLINFMAPTANVAYDVHLIGITCAILYFFGGLNFYMFDDLRGFTRRSMRRMLGTHPKLFRPSDEDMPMDSDDEADRILAKIHEKGQDSLTSKERKFLERYSQSVRKRKETIE